MITHKSLSHKVTEIGTTTEWQLADDALYRITKKNTNSYPYHKITAIRLCYHMGGKGSPARYCCYLQIDDEWNSKYIFSSTNSQTNTTDYQEYYLFVTSLLQKVKQANPSVRFISGHGMGSLSLYIVTCIIVLLFPYIIYKYQIISYNEHIWITVVLFALCLPMIGSIVKFYTREIIISEIPKKVLPKPTS